MISPLAYIHPEAQIGQNVEIGPFVYIDKNVIIGDNNTIMPKNLKYQDLRMSMHVRKLPMFVWEYIWVVSLFYCSL